MATRAEADAGKGNEHVGEGDISIPWLVKLEKLSPQTDKADAKHIPGAEAGMILFSTTDELFERCLVVPVTFQSRWNEWVPRTRGGGFVRGFALGEEPEGVGPRQIQMDAPNDNEYVKSHYHYVLLLKGAKEVGAPGSKSYRHDLKGVVDIEPCVISMASTQISVSAKWNTSIGGKKARGKNGQYFQMPRYSHTYALSTVDDDNEKGKWKAWSVGKGFVLDLTQEIDREVYAAAKSFESLVESGAAVAREAVRDDEKKEEDVPF
jgi:hypothetical protein